MALYTTWPYTPGWANVDLLSMGRFQAPNKPHAVTPAGMHLAEAALAQLSQAP